AADPRCLPTGCADTLSLLLQQRPAAVLSRLTPSSLSVSHRSAEIPDDLLGDPAGGFRIRFCSVEWPAGHTAVPVLAEASLISRGPARPGRSLLSGRHPLDLDRRWPQADQLHRSEGVPGDAIQGR